MTQIQRFEYSCSKLRRIQNCYRVSSPVRYWRECFVGRGTPRNCRELLEHMVEVYTHVIRRALRSVQTNFADHGRCRRGRDYTWRKPRNFSSFSRSQLPGSYPIFGVSRLSSSTSVLFEASLCTHDVVGLYIGIETKGQCGDPFERLRYCGYVCNRSVAKRGG